VFKKGNFARYKTTKKMTKTEYLAIASAQWESFHALEKEESFYEYEKKFDALWIGLGRQVFERSLSVCVKDRRKKKATYPLR
jgi:hypothetical protein